MSKIEWWYWYGRVNSFMQRCELTVDDNFEGISDEVTLSGDGDGGIGDFKMQEQ